jgi:hypothetical protein
MSFPHGAGLACAKEGWESERFALDGVTGDPLTTHRNEHYFMIFALFGILAVVIGICSLVCGIMVLVKQFQSEPGPLHGIIGIVTCLFWGWINATKLNIKKLMMLWTALIVAGLLIQGILAIAAGGEMAKQIELQQLQQQQQPTQ